MVGVEAGKEVFPDDLPGGALAPQGVGDERQVFLQGFFAVDGADEIHEAAYDVILEILIVADGDDVIFVRLEGDIFAGVPVAAGIRQALHVQGVAAEHTAHGVGDQGGDLVPQGAGVGAALHRLRDVLPAVKDAVDGDVFVGDVGGEFVPQTVNVDEDAVEGFFVGF